MVTGDVLDVDLAEVLTAWRAAPPDRSPVRVVGNLPYNIASPIMFRLLELGRRTGGFGDATLMLQSEVADRLVAVPGTGDYGVLTVLTAVQRRR